MQTESIIESIRKVPAERTAFVTNASSTSYGSILRTYERNICVIKEMLHGSCVSIRRQSRYDFALLLSILDGHVKRIVFMPEDIDDSLLSRYYEESEVNYEVFIKDDELHFDTIKESGVGASIGGQITEWVIPTSGTTKNPKLVSHTFSSITRSTLRDIEKGKGYVWGLTFDIYRFSGIQVFLQSILGGATLVIPESLGNIQEVLRLFAVKRCNAVSATPTFWRKCLMVKEVDLLSLKRITLGGEIVDAHILAALKDKFVNTKIIHIYASTEVGVGFSVTDGASGFPQSLLESDSDSHIKLEVRDNSLWINPGFQAQKYLSQKESPIFDQNGFINTGDLVELKNDRVYFLGRESGAINVGGNKVQPEEVEQVLLDSNLLTAAYVYAKKSPMTGALVCADIVAKNALTEKKELKLQVQKYCRERLEAFKRPVLLNVVGEISTTQSGKLKRT